MRMPYLHRREQLLWLLIQRMEVLAVDGSVFTSPGVYHYLVTEVSGDYEGMDYDNSTYDVYLYVYNSNNGLYVGNAVSVKNGDKADLAFTNDYGAREDNDSTHDITVIKEVTGTMGNKASQEFQFAVSVDGGEGEWYQVLVKRQLMQPQLNIM